MNLFTSKQAKALDDYIEEELRVPLDILAERAGRALADACLAVPERLDKKEGSFSKFEVIAGAGMNGADALICAQHLHAAKKKVRIHTVFNDPEFEGKVHPLTMRNYQACLAIGIKVCRYPGELKDIKYPRLVLDGLFGTGFKLDRPLPDRAIKLLLAINSLASDGSYIIAADLPSGIDADTGQMSPLTVKADETVTFISPKIGNAVFPGAGNCGRLTVNNLGIRSDLVRRFLESEHNPVQDMSVRTLSNKTYLRNLLPVRKQDSHKGTFGRILLVGGSPGMEGSICLTGEAALRSGAGMIYMKVPEEIAVNCTAALPEALLVKNYSDLSSLDFIPDGVAAGPGGEDSDDFESYIEDFILNAKNLVLDAQALNLVAAKPGKYKNLLRERREKGFPLPVMTPHPGEMRRLLPDEEGKDRLFLAKKAASEYQALVVLKGAASIIATPKGKIFVNLTGNSAMAKAGSGDILAGVLVAFMVQGMKALEASILGVYLHGLAGDLAARDKSEYGAIPQDTIVYLPAAFKKLSEGDSSDA